MMSGTLVTRVFLLSAAASFALANANANANTIGWLARRQDDDDSGFDDPFVNLPPQCEETCQPLFDFQCEARECECTNDNAQLLARCLNCVVGAGGSQSVAQSSFDTFRDACARDGLPITPIEITPSASGSASGTGSPPSTDSTTSETEPTTTPPPTTTTSGTTSPATTTGTTPTGTGTGTTSTGTGTGTETSDSAGQTGTGDDSNGTGKSFNAVNAVIFSIAMVVVGLVIGY